MRNIFGVRCIIHDEFTHLIKVVLLLIYMKHYGICKPVMFLIQAFFPFDGWQICIFYEEYCNSLVSI